MRTSSGCRLPTRTTAILDYQHFVPGQAHHPLSTPDRIMHVGQEYRPPFYGHISLFNLQKHLISPFVTGYEGTGVESLYPSNTDILRYAKGAGRHRHPTCIPTAARVIPSRSTLGTAKGLPVDVALGAVSYHELWSQSAGDAPLMVWYRLLNAGFRVPVTGGEDSISNLHDIELVASVRGYFHLGSQPLTWANWMKAMLGGRGFVTNGPLIEFTVNGLMPGEELRCRRPGERHQVKADGQLGRASRTGRGRAQRGSRAYRHVAQADSGRQASTPARRSRRAAGIRCAPSGRHADVSGGEHATAGGDQPGLSSSPASPDSGPSVGRVLRAMDRSAHANGQRTSRMAQRDARRRTCSGQFAEATGYFCQTRVGSALMRSGMRQSQSASWPGGLVVAAIGLVAPTDGRSPRRNGEGACRRNADRRLRRTTATQQRGPRRGGADQRGRHRRHAAGAARRRGDLHRRHERAARPLGHARAPDVERAQRLRPLGQDVSAASSARSSCPPRRSNFCWPA